ncbi:MAG: hypothetical protein ACD_44C00148G0004 [uncultured bacterium]|nr:MAG: hypothetical protein ACD_44C00148G0004 [uncultured bacterium]
MQNAAIKKVFWKEIRTKILSVNHQLTKVIDDIDPGEKFPLYLASYPYGSSIVNEGVFYLPSNEGEIIPIDDIRIDSKMRADFTYSGKGLPAGIVLKNTAHESIGLTKQILPVGVVSPGSIFALWRKLDAVPSFHPIKMFTITAGARFIFMLPNISDHSLHKNLKRDFNVRQLPPKTLIEQWDIFKSITHHPLLDCDWATELLFFSEQWFEKIKHDNAWRTLYLLMLEKAWQKSAYERNQMLYNLAFSGAQANRNLKPNPYLADTAKHLFMMAAGIVPGFGVAADDSCAPVSLLQKVYVESYGIRGYNPTMFLPKHFSLFEANQPIYYSLTFPTTLEFSPKSRKISSTLQDLSELRHVMQIFIEEIYCNKLKVEDTIICNIATHAEFEYFHSKLDRHGEIKLTRDMVIGDSSLTYYSENTSREFADSGSLIRGCVRIAKK